MDSLTALDYFASGYSLLYENGLFRQKLVDGEQVEIPDEWIEKGGAWLVPRPEKSVSVRFGGQIKEKWKNGRLTIENTEYDEVRAVAYDLMIPGTETNAVNTLRLWRAKDVSIPSLAFGTQGDYVKSLEGKNKAEEITRQLYPNDNYDEGKLLRLTQQYFLVSASLQSIFSDYYATYGSLAGFSDKIAIHINDTHPALCVPELMRILMDQYSYSWEDAWETVVKTVSYTNHTVLPEALECWRVDLFRLRLPRIYMIVEEINRRFCANLWELYPGDWDRISRMAIVAYGQVRMANLSVVGSHTVNGVSALHSDILKKTVFHDFYKMTPWKFTNVTNGVFHRRWLASANPALTSLIN
jgi:starch phosphorylase